MVRAKIPEGALLAGRNNLAAAPITPPTPSAPVDTGTPITPVAPTAAAAARLFPLSPRFHSPLPRLLGDDCPNGNDDCDKRWGGFTSCRSCHSGAYHHEDGIDECCNCPAGKFQPNENFNGNECTDCGEGQWSEIKATSCQNLFQMKWLNAIYEKTNPGETMSVNGGDPYIGAELGTGMNGEYISKGVTLECINGSGECIIDGEDKHRCLQIYDVKVGEVVIKNIKIKRGRARPGKGGGE